jgi:carbonic anhydrase/acetyltransferase-like protein (isoleucine patch superfamily)
MPFDRPEQLLETLRSLYESLRLSMRRRYDRDLPFDELVFDRWERAGALGFGDRASIYHNTYVFGEVAVGADTWVGPLVMLDGSGDAISIGAWCCISAGVQIYTHDTVQRSLTGGRAATSHAPVRIGDFTYIGSQSLILPGVTIGEHCVVGAGSLVNRDVPSYSIAVGMPARVRGRVTLDEAGERAELEWTDEAAESHPIA